MTRKTKGARGLDWGSKAPSDGLYVHGQITSPLSRSVGQTDGPGASKAPSGSLGIERALGVPRTPRPVQPILWSGPSSQGPSPARHTSSLLCLLPPWPFLTPPPAGLPSPWPSPSACPVLFCTSLLPGDRPTKNSPCSLSRPQLPKEEEMRGAGRPMSCSPPQTPSPKSGPALQPGMCANLAISGAPHTPSLGGGLPISAYNLRAILTPREGERRPAVWRETFPISDKSVPTTLWAPRGQGLAPRTGLLRAEGIGVGKSGLVLFILAQLEGRQNSAPASIMPIPHSPKCVGADRGVSVATPRCHGVRSFRGEVLAPTHKDGSLEARTGHACQAGHMLPPS